ncbi:MAG: 2-oxoacid:acceptor oxidoreductase family protein [Culicoidibacterales bacterium]
MEFIPNAHGFVEIRLESIGGQGAYSAGQMLAQIGVEGSNLHAICFADYGSEKKGAPVKTFIRFAKADTTILNYSPVNEPQVVAVFHELLFKTQPVTDGLHPDGILIVNTDQTPEQLRELYNLNVKTIVTVDATKIALQYKTKLNTAMLGAIFSNLHFLDASLAADSIEKMFGYKYPHLVKPNIDTFTDGMQQAQTHEFSGIDEAIAYTRKATPFGYETQNQGGEIAGPNSYTKNLTASREGMMPEYLNEKCIHCSNCDNVCPDFCFVWEEGTDARGRAQMFLQGIDYNYCKGCLKCVEVCPTQALVSMVEERNYADEHRVKKPFNFLGGVK